MSQKQEAFGMRTAMLVLFLGPLSLVAAGCSSTGSHAIRRGYEQEIGASASLGTLLLSTKNGGPSTNAPRDSQRAAPPGRGTVHVTKQGRAVLRPYYRQVLIKALAAHILTPDSSATADTLSLTTASLSLPSGASMAVRVPGSSKPLRLYRQQPQFLLLLSHLRFDVATKKERGPNLVAPEITYGYMLKGRFAYVLWDNRAGKAAAYGHVHQSLSSAPQPEARDYLELFWKMTLRMVEQTPLAPSSG